MNRDKKTVDSIAYLHFNSEEDLLQFKANFSGHVFISDKGKEKRVEVDYAPYQSWPKGAGQPDSKYIGTIESGIFSKTTKLICTLQPLFLFLKDADYLAFLEELKKPVQPLPSAEEQLDKRLKEQPGNQKRLKQCQIHLLKILPVPTKQLKPQR